jgi:spoIIIJ-associated protein
VEWVEVAGKTIDEATEQALDQLGVGPGDAEIIVVNEPKMGLFGRVRVEARVRARVRPVGARPKRERSRRGNGRSGQGSRQGGERGGERSSSSGSRSGSGGRAANGGGRSSATTTAPAYAETNGDADADASGANGSQSGRSNENGSAGTGTGTSRSARRRRNRSKASAGAAAAGEGTRERSRNGSNGEPSGARAPRRSNESKEPKETVDMAEGMTLEEQGEIGRTFLVGLLAEYGLEATVESRLLDEDTVEIAANGDDLGMLVGPRGSTLAALQDLTRAVVQRQCPSRTDRILVDVAGYRERRSAALKRFSVQIAEEVISSGQEKALEAMSPADRKSVHDAINEMDGVVTRSEGEDPNRYIVIAPAS